MVCKISGAVVAAAGVKQCPQYVTHFLASLVQITPKHIMSKAHVDYAKTALAARDYISGASLVENLKLYDVAPGMVPRDVLLYHFYSGLLFCGAEKWSLASGMFKTVSGLGFVFFAGPTSCSTSPTSVPWFTWSGDVGGTA